MPWHFLNFLPLPHEQRSLRPAWPYAPPLAPGGLYRNAAGAGKTPRCRRGHNLLASRGQEGVHAPITYRADGFTVGRAALGPGADDAGHLSRRRRGRQRHALRGAVRRVAAHRHGQRRRSRVRDARSHHGRRQGRRPHADRSSDHDALPRRSLRRDGGASPARIPIRDFIDHGPNVQPHAGDRRVPAEGLSAALREEHAHRREAGRQASRMQGLDVRIVASAGQIDRERRCPAPAAANPTARPTSRRIPTRARTRSRSARTSRSARSGPCTSAT